MIGNSAGPVFTLYFLAMRLPKKEFIEPEPGFT